MTKKRKPAIKIKSTAKSKARVNTNFDHKKNDIEIKAAKLKGRKKADDKLKGWESYYKDLYPKNWKSKMLNEIVNPVVSDSKNRSIKSAKNLAHAKIRAQLNSYDSTFKQYKKKILLQKNERKK